MEKKTYLAPQMRIHKLYRRMAPFCSSPIRSQSSGGADVDLGYGGVDEEGIVNPSAKRRGFSDYDSDLW
jgi:hypothetical protein